MKRALRLASCAGLLLLGVRGSWAQQSAPTPLGDALRTRIAACDACHGPQASAAPTAVVPSLAAQPQPFLEAQLVLLREGVRASSVMQPVLQGMTDAELTELSAHYAAQPAPPPAAARNPELHARGRELAAVRRCASCHLDDFRGRDQSPRLVNQREDYLLQALLDFRELRRTGTDGTMNEVVAGLSDADVRALAHFASQGGSGR